MRPTVRRFGYLAGEGRDGSRGWGAEKGGEGLEITCCLFRMDRKLEGVKCASETTNTRTRHTSDRDSGSKETTTGFG